MRILLINHATASEWGGGDSVQMEETARVLKQRGHIVKIQNTDNPETDGFDIAHIFNCRVASSFFKQISKCKADGIPTIVSPIWINIGRALWGSRGTYGILTTMMNGNNIDKELRLLKERKLIVDMGNGTLNSDGKGTFDLKWQEDVGKLLQTVDGLLPNSWLELKAVQTDLGWHNNNFNIAHYGVNSKKFLDADPNLFREYTGIKGSFIMQAGRIEAGKNQAMLCYALKETNIPIVLIGGTKHWPAYAKLCKDIGGGQVTVIDHLQQDILASAYSAAKVHCLASWMDTCGLVSLEAALSGTPLVGSTFGHELEYLKTDAWLADPGDPRSIRDAVIQAWETGKDNSRTRNLKERILAKYNWEKTASATERLYKTTIENA